MVQEREQTIDQLKRLMDELKAETHRQEAALAGHKAKNVRLEATLEHFRRHMRERESTLEDKEASVHDLRRKNSTLDNFRCDHLPPLLKAPPSPFPQPSRPPVLFRLVVPGRPAPRPRPAATCWTTAWSSSWRSARPLPPTSASSSRTSTPCERLPARNPGREGAMGA